MDAKFMARIEALRVAFNEALTVESAFRCKTWNDKVGGQPNSHHTIGNAIDFRITDSRKRYRFVALAQSLGFKGIGIDKHFIHIDGRDGQSVMWVYPL